MENLTPQLNQVQLKQNIDGLIKQGAPKDVVQQYVNNYRLDGSGNYVLANAPQQNLANKEFTLGKDIKNVGQELGQDIKGVGQGIKSDLEKRSININEAGSAAARGEQGALRTGLQGAGQGAGFVSDVIGQVFKGAVKGVLSQEDENNVKANLANVISPIVNSTKGIIDKYEQLKTTNPALARDIDAALGFGSLVTDIGLGGGAKTVTETAKVGAEQAIKAGVQAGKEAAGTVAKLAGETAEQFAKRTGQVASDVSSKVKSVVAKGKDVITPTETNVLDELVTPVMTQKASTAAIKTGKVVEGTGLTGKRSFTEAVPNLEKMKESLLKVPGVSSKKTFLENANAVRDEIVNSAKSLEDQIAKAEKQVGRDRGFFTPSEFKSYMKKAKSNISENPLLVGDAEKTANKIFSKFESLVKTEGHTPSGLLRARKKLDAWMKSQKGSKVFSPDTDNAVSVALREIRQGGNDFLASKVPDVAVKESLAHQANLYNILDIAAEKAAKEAPSKLRRFIQKNPRATKAAKYGASTAIGGGIVGIIAD